MAYEITEHSPGEPIEGQIKFHGKDIMVLQRIDETGPHWVKIGTYKSREGDFIRAYVNAMKGIEQ